MTFNTEWSAIPSINCNSPNAYHFLMSGACIDLFMAQEYTFRIVLCLDFDIDIRFVVFIRTLLPF